MRGRKGKRHSKKQTKAFIRKGCGHSGLSGKIQSERAGWRERINEAYFGKYQRNSKGRNVKRDVNKRTGNRAVKEKTLQRTLCQRPQEPTEEETLPFTD